MILAGFLTGAWLCFLLKGRRTSSSSWSTCCLPTSAAGFRWTCLFWLNLPPDCLQRQSVLVHHVKYDGI